MKLIADKVTPKQFWGRKFIDSNTRKYVVLAGYIEKHTIENSIVYFTDEAGKMLTDGMKWNIFLITYVPSMLEDNIYDVH